MSQSADVARVVADETGESARARLTERRVRLAIAAVVFAAAWGASAFCARGVSTVLAPDSATYFDSVASLFQRAPTWFPLRTPLYSAVSALVHAAGGSARELLLLQAALRAVACGAVAWHLGRTRPRVALGAGLLLAVDPVAASMTSAYLSESLYSTGLLLGLAVLVTQVSEPAPLRRGRLVAAGLLFGWATLFRPSGMLLIAPAVAAYWAVTGSLASAVWVSTGYSIVAAAVALFNCFKYGALTLAAGGLYLAFPLFAQHLFTPANGPTSAALHGHLQACDPALDYDAVVLGTANSYIHGTFWPCLAARVPGGRLGASEMLSRAYREALRSRPIVFTERMLAEGLVFLGTPASAYVAELAASGDDRVLGRLCAGAPQTFAAFACPTPPQDRARRALVETWGARARLFLQPYLAVDGLTRPGHVATRRGARLIGGLAGSLFLCLALAVARPPYRVWVAGAVTVVVANAASTALGAVTLIRYAAVNSPFLVLISTLTLVSLIEAGVSRHRSRIVPSSPA